MYKKPKVIHNCHQLHILRHHKVETRSLGTMLAMSPDFVTHYLCVCLELPFNANKKNISCSNVGTFEAECVIHEKFGRCIYIKNVVGRTGMFIHAGNFVWNSKGCTLPGVKFKDLDNDGKLDVYNSGEAMFMLWWSLKKEFTLIIH